MYSLEQVACAACFGLSIICLYLLSRLSEAKRRSLSPEIRYIDSTGVMENPPRMFIETWQGKTLNFKFDKWIVCIPMVTVRECVFYVGKIAGCFLMIHELMQWVKENDILEAGRTPQQKLKYFIEKKIAQVKQIKVYNIAVDTLYKLSVQHVNKRSGYKKALKNQCKDFLWAMDVLEQINDYWQTVKKKAQMLSQGQTLKQMDGYSSTWQGFTLDRQGNRLVKPRYA